MTESSFGGFDINALMGQAQAMKESMAQAQNNLADENVTGSTGGGAVNVVLSGLGDLRAIEIKPGTFDGNDEESLTDLGDLIVAAFRDAKTQVDARAQESMTAGISGLLGGMGGAGGLGGLGAMGGLGGLGALFGGNPAGAAGDTDPAANADGKASDEGNEPPMKFGF